MDNKNIIIFIGPPGSGKGTISKLCMDQFRWSQLSTGNLCRHHIANQTKIGQEIAFAIKSGNLISDNLITGMVEEWLSEKIYESHAIILDGYPRAVAQARAFDRIVKDKFPALRLHVVRFTVPDPLLVTRLSSRIVCRNSDCQSVYSLIEDSPMRPKQTMRCDACASELGQRDDDQLTAVRERLNIYYKHENDLVGFYHSIGQPVVELQADRPLELVFGDFKRLLGF